MHDDTPSKTIQKKDTYKKHLLADKALLPRCLIPGCTNTFVFTSQICLDNSPGTLWNVCLCLYHLTAGTTGDKRPSLDGFLRLEPPSMGSTNERVSFITKLLVDLSSEKTPYTKQAPIRLRDTLGPLFCAHCRSADITNEMYFLPLHGNCDDPQQCMKNALHAKTRSEWVAVCPACTSFQVYQI